MSQIQTLNQGADIARGSQATFVNINAAKGLEEVMKTNLGPRGTLKMLVGGAGQITLTKDGKGLLDQMVRPIRP
jgi:T-complex protein 1 subunit zeta